MHLEINSSTTGSIQQLPFPGCMQLLWTCHFQMFLLSLLFQRLYIITSFFFFYFGCWSLTFNTALCCWYKFANVGFTWFIHKNNRILKWEEKLLISIAFLNRTRIISLSRKNKEEGKISRERNAGRTQGGLGWGSIFWRSWFACSPTLLLGTATSRVGTAMITFEPL